jgi:hypothetical protein
MSIERFHPAAMKEQRDRLSKPTPRAKVQAQVLQWAKRKMRCVSWGDQRKVEQRTAPDDRFKGKLPQRSNHKLKVKNKPRRFLFRGFSLVNEFLQSSNHKASVEDGFVFIPKSGVTPAFEFINFIGYQHLHSLPQLFLKQKCIKAHLCENGLYIIQHGKISKVKK